MKIQIRRGVFETNSSSVHSMTMCSADDYKAWENGEMKFCDYKEQFLPNDEADKVNEQLLRDDNYATIEDVSGYNLRYYYLTYDQYYDNIEYETFEQEYNGVVAFGYYGSNY